MTKSTDIATTLEELPLGIDLVLRMKDGGETAGIFEGLRNDQALMADGTETAFPLEVPITQIADVLITGDTSGPE